jgi:acetyl-CoA carboxylase biotin carboxyl carrier protein
MSRVEVKSEIPGKVIRIEVGVGDSVAEDDALMMVESMKMEIPIPAPIGGKVVEILVADGEAVTEGQVVARLEV